MRFFEVRLRMNTSLYSMPPLKISSPNIHVLEYRVTRSQKLCFLKSKRNIPCFGMKYKEERKYLEKFDMITYNNYK